MIRILIVDDKPESLYLLRSLLQGHGCAVEEARHGAEALVKARQQPPDLIVSDLLMPVMDGYTLLRHWKFDERLRTIPFVVYTATYTEPQDERLARQLGADAFILKPAEPDAFMAEIREVLDKAEHGQLAAHGPTKLAEELVLSEYSQTLVRKLEEKALQLQESNRALAEDLARRHQAEAEAAQAHEALLRTLAEQRKIEEELRREQNLFQSLTGAIPDEIYFKDRESRFVRINDTMVRKFGLTGAADAVGKTDLDFFTAEHARKTYADEQRLMRTGEPLVNIEEKVTWRSGQVTWVSTTKVPLKDAQGGVTGLVGISRDITEKKQLEARFLRAQRLESIGALASGIAHDLNNVLAPILMGVALLRQSVHDEHDRVLLGTMEKSAQRGADIVRQVLTFARGSEGQRVPLQPKHVVRDMLKFADQIFPKNIKLVDRSAREVAMVEGDATQLHQALMNLCVNARDAMPQGGTLTLAADNVTVDAASATRFPSATPGPYVRLRVADTGAGMAPEVQERLFEPFFTTKGVGRGTGLGLFMVLGIAKGHGGFVRFESQPGKGTTFELFLPAARSTAVTAPPAEGPLPRANGELILLVDDEAAIREVARQALEEFGYRVISAAGGAAAIEVFRTARAEVKLVVTDMMMPEMDGPDLVRALRAIAPGVRVVGITGVLDPPTTTSLEALALSGMLAKPFTIGQLLKAAHDGMNSGAAPPAPPAEGA